MLTKAGAAAAEVEGELDMIKGFMLSKSVPKETRRMVMAKMETFYKGKGLYDETEILVQILIFCWNVWILYWNVRILF